jgi:hypothetical protein
MAPGNDRAAVVSGADVGDAARRRNIPGTPQEVIVQPPQVDDKKKTKPQPSVLDVLSDWEWFIAPIVFTALAFFTRFYKIGLSPIVTWVVAQCVPLSPPPPPDLPPPPLQLTPHAQQFWKVRQPLPEARILLRRACKLALFAQQFESRLT